MVANNEGPGDATRIVWNSGMFFSVKKILLCFFTNLIFFRLNATYDDKRHVVATNKIQMMGFGGTWMGWHFVVVCVAAKDRWWVES